MPQRYQKKKTSLRGHRRHGHGNVKNRRGSGNRGGRGNAGLKKQKWIYTVKYAKDHFGNKGFVRHGVKHEMDTINVWEIEKMAKSGALKEEKGLYIFDFDGKVLGAGLLTLPIKLKAKKITEKAREKIKNAGGNVEVPSEV